MDANLMRLAWSVVDETPVSRQRSLSSGDRIDPLLREMENRVVLSADERQQVQQYLLSRQQLITDLYA